MTDARGADHDPRQGSFGATGPPKLSYASYLKIRELTGLQRRLSDPPEHDELLFIVVHQVYELWFKQLLHELDEVMARLRDGEALDAQRLLHRCIEIERILLAQLTVLETMTPDDFLTFRDRLMPASGFQSMQFRALEAVSGLADPRHLRMFEEGSPEHRELARRLEGPTLRDAFFRLLAERGFDAAEPSDGEAEEERASAPDEARAGGTGSTGTALRERRIRALKRLYGDPKSHYDLYLLAEALIEYDEMFTLWRLRHVTMVERMIGAKPGTGGSEGVAYLKTTLDRKFFPELWEVRSHLGSS